MDGEHSLRKNCGDDIRGQRHGETPSESGGSAGLTCETDSLCDLQVRTDRMGREYVPAEGLSFVEDLCWVATASDVNPVVPKPERCAANRMEWAGRGGLRFDTAETEATRFTRS